MAEDILAIFLAGRLAEARFTGTRNYAGALSDYEEVTMLVRLIEGRTTRDSYLKYIEALADQLVGNHWHLVETLAAALMESSRLSGSRARSVLRHARLGTNGHDGF